MGKKISHIKCPHCKKKIIKHYHPKKGSDISCIHCLGVDDKQFWEDEKKTDPKYKSEDSVHATWPGEWPWDPNFSKK